MATSRSTSLGSSWLASVGFQSISSDRTTCPCGRSRLLERLKEQLWLLSKSLTRAREDALIYARTNGHGSRYNSAAVLLLRRLKQVTAELDFLEELRREIDYL